MHQVKSWDANDLFCPLLSTLTELSISETTRVLILPCTCEQPTRRDDLSISHQPYPIARQPVDEFYPEPKST
jgi:hypothetical protein